MCSYIYTSTKYYYKFVPQEDAYYKISSSNSTLQIYDESLNIQSANVDGYSALNDGCIYYVIINKNNYSSNEIILSVLDRMEIFFYDNISDVTPVKTMYYSTINPKDLHVSSRDGYNFIGWETSDGIQVSDINDFIKPTLNLYARWETIIYNINYYGIDDSIIKNDTYTIETGFNLDNTIAIDNYIILSWQDENGNEIPKYSDMIGNINCYPNWVKEKSIITFNLASEITDNIEATLSENIQSIELNYNESTTLPIPQISGFEFEGWYYGATQITNNKGQMFTNVNFKDDTILTSKWIRTEYHFNIETIISNDSYSFILSMRNSLDISNFIIPTNAISDNKIVAEVINNKIDDLLEEALRNNDLSMELYKPGYHFEYCTTVLNDSSSRIYWIELNDTKNNFILYPYYESNEYSINIYKEDELLQTIDVNYEQYYEKYTNNNACFIPKYNTTITGYIYQGVYKLNGEQMFDSNSKLTSSGLEYLKSLVNLSNIDLKIKSNPITYQIKYNSNGGSGTMANSIHNYDITKALSKNTLKKTGYVFIGWNTSLDGTGISYDDSEIVVNLTNINNNIIVLYAQWEVITYTVKYTPNGTNGIEYSYTYYYNQTFSILNNPYSKIGYTFKGWSKYSNGSIEFLPGDSVQNLTSENDKTNHKGCSNRANMALERVDEVFQKEVEHIVDLILEDEEKFINFVKSYKEIKQPKQEDHSLEISKLKVENNKLNKKIEALFEAKLNDELPLSTYERMMSMYKQQVLEIEDKIRKFESIPKAPQIDYVAEANELINILKIHQDNCYAKREFIIRFLQKILITKKDVNNYSMKLTYISSKIIKEYELCQQKLQQST